MNDIDNRVRAQREGKSLPNLLRDDEIGCSHSCLCSQAADEIERLTAAQWPREATEEMKQAIYKLNLGGNRMSEDDVIDIYDTWRGVVEQNARGETNGA